MRLYPRTQDVVDTALGGRRSRVPAAQHSTPAAVAGSPVLGLGRRPGSPLVLAAEYQGNRDIAGTDYVTSIPFLGARRLPHDFKTCVSPFYANQM